MADLKKKNTSKLGKINSRHIGALQVDDRDKENPQLVMSFEEEGDGHYLPVSKHVYEMVKEGIGLSHPRLRNGLLNCSKFRFVLVTDDVKSKKKGAEPKKTIVAIHLIPDHPYNLCDWTEELGQRVDRDHAIVELQPDTGDICVKAFPNRLVGSMDSFVSALEKLTSIDGSTRFKAGSLSCNVISIYGNEVTFRCTAATSSKIR